MQTQWTRAASRRSPAVIAVEAGAAVNAALVTIGDRLGLYRAMADAQPVTAAELAARTGTHERYVREWLNAQAASGFVDLRRRDDTYVLPAEHAFVLADETSPCRDGRDLPGRERRDRRPRAGRRAVPHRRGLGWHEHHHDLFYGTERAFGANYRTHLVHRVAAGARRRRREARARRARRRRRLRARRLGDPHGPGVPGLDGSRLRLPRRLDRHGAPARRRGRGGRPGDASRSPTRTRTAARATTSSRSSTHSTTSATRSGAARHARAALAAGRHCVVVEPYAGDAIEDNLNPDRALLLRHVDARLHARLPVTARACGARDPGRRGPPARGAHAGGFAHGPARRRDAAQPRPRGTRSVDRLVELPPAVLHEAGTARRGRAA